MVIIGGRAHTLEEVEKVGQLGFPFAEINISDPDEVADQFDDLLKMKETYGMYYLAHYPNEGNPTEVERLEQQFVPKMKRLFELTHDLEIRKGTLHFWMDKRWADTELISAKIELLSDMVQHASQYDLVLCLENLTSQYDSFSPVFDAIPDLRMTMDIGHAELLAKINASFGFIEHLFHKIDHVHVHDNMGGTSVQDDLHLPLGDGIVDYPKILSLLKEKGYASTLTMEVKPADMIHTRDEVIRHMQDSGIK